MKKEKEEKKIRHFSKKTLIYSIGTIISSVAVLLAAPIFTRTLTTAEFGNYELSYALIYLLCTVGFFDIFTSTLRFMYGEKEENTENRNKAIYSSALLVIILIAILFFTVPITALITPLPFVKAALFYGVLFSISKYYQIIARGCDRELEYSLGFSIYHIINLLTVCYLLVIKDYSSWSLLVAMGCGHIIEIIYLEYKLRLIINFKLRYIDFHLMGRIFHFAVPLAVSAAGGWILNYYTNIKIVEILGADSNGIYSMSVNIARSIPSITYGVLLAWQEIAFSFKGCEVDKRKFFSEAIENIIVTLSLLYVLFLSLSTLVVPYYLGPSYHGVLDVMYITCACMTFETISNMLASIFGNSINSKPIMISIIIGAGIDLLTLTPLINSYGIIGAGYSSMIGFGITCIIRAIWIIGSEKLKINYIKILFYISIGVLGGYLCKSKDTVTLIMVAAVSGAMFLYYFRKGKKKDA
jgi:O-antigen/teichoic acid export membrane protein